MSTSLGWECPKCTYYHQAPGTRCVMCDSLRVTKEQIRDFVTGKSLGRLSSSSSSTITSTSSSTSQSSKPLTNSTTEMPAHLPQQIRPSSSSSLRSIRNPYAKQKSSVGMPPKDPQTTSTSPENDVGESNLSKSNRPMAPLHLPPTSDHRPPQHGVFSQGRTTTPLPVLQSRPTSVGAIERSQENPFTMAIRPSRVPYIPGPVPVCADAATVWIYPIHKDYPIRDYQLEISKTSIHYNTLVSLPTGLGKTLIAAVVLYNYYRYFPTGKVIFMAPTLPLVDQQVKACYDIMGIPAQDTAILTGKVPAKERELLWHQRRVFFCTPQTVQRDIDGGRCPASQVVCIVLDEAHKACGAYAYTKVVELLEHAGAKFRILGLSATPGGEIKAIQKVITALRIHKIETRTDEDPSVKKYVHARHNEIVVVQQMSAVTNIERLLNNLISPLLERLRTSNGLALIRGNATVTPYCLIRAKQEYCDRTNDHSLDGYFFAANKFVSIRSDLRTIGIGVARAKLIRIENEVKGGLMASIVKGSEFKAVVEAVLRASSDPNQCHESAEDRKLNNPKLMKLDEILTLHFERARACGESSRAIVFSQWRESVSEIVSVLSSENPLLRPRCFVGQGTSLAGTKKSGVDRTCLSLKGMKQKEQQQVIRDFQEGKFNILVCTCIGEEGLDIGEVDLIVNYDSLRSPIRMIQRVGRTGRKRDGRVVCLVSEGSEEKTMLASKQAEKTLARALKRPDAFVVAPNDPMFPQDPVLQHRDMTISTFHLSQVGGNSMMAKSKRDGVSDKGGSSEGGDGWKLADGEEERRQVMFGDIQTNSFHECGISGGHFPRPLRRRLLRARARSVSTCRDRHGPGGVGITRRILLDLEDLHGPKSVAITGELNRLTGTNRSIRDADSLQLFFPCERSPERDHATKIQTVDHTAFACEELNCDFVVYEGNVAKLDDTDEYMPPNDIEQINDQKQQYQFPKTMGGWIWNESTSVENVRSNIVCPRNAYATRPHVNQTVRECATDVVPTYPGMSLQNADESRIIVGEFRLPTPPDSSSSEDSESDDERVGRLHTVGSGKPDLASMRPELIHSAILPENKVIESSYVTRSSPNGITDKSNKNSVAEPKFDSSTLTIPTHDSSSTLQPASKLIDVSTSSTEVQGHNQPLPQRRHLEKLSDAIHEAPSCLVASLALLLPTQESSSDDGSRDDECTASDKSTTSECSVSPLLPVFDCPLIEGPNDDQHGQVRTVKVQELPPPGMSNAMASDVIVPLSSPGGSHSLVHDGQTNDEASLEGNSQEANSNVIPTNRIHNTIARHIPTEIISSAALFTNTQSPIEFNNSDLASESPTMNMKVSYSRKFHAILTQNPSPLQNTPTISIKYEQDDLFDTPQSQERRMHLAACEIVDTPPRLYARSLTRGIDEDLVDTPESQRRVKETQFVPNGKDPSPSSDDNVDNVVCLVCYSGDSPDDDPIVLCDGPNGEFSCRLAVHKSCYSISEPLDEIDSWRCDPCDFEHSRRLNEVRNGPSNFIMKCQTCHKSGGPLKRVGNANTKKWVHVYCRYPNNSNQNAMCLYCFDGPGLTCEVGGCNASAHPHCAIVASRAPWAILKRQEADSQSGFLVFCPSHVEKAKERLESIGVDYKGVVPLPRCIVFPTERFPMKPVDPIASDAANQQSSRVVSRKRLKKMEKVNFDEMAGVTERKRAMPGLAEDQSLDCHDVDTYQKRKRIQQRMQERQRGMMQCRFLDIEADIDTDEDVDGDEVEDDELREIEDDEELHSSFINDTSQLGYVHDELDRIDPSGNYEMQTPCESTSMHRAIDIEKERMNLFATPILNRRMKKHSRRPIQTPQEHGTPHDWDQPTPLSAPSAEKGLGNMHFIRSVLEHHRNGGEVDEIEEAYHQIALENSESEDEPMRPENPSGPITIQYVASDSEDSNDEDTMSCKPSVSVTPRAVSDDGNARPSMSSIEPLPTVAHGDSMVSVASGNISAEQRAMIETKRQEAFRRRQQLLLGSK